MQNNCSNMTRSKNENKQPNNHEVTKKKSGIIRSLMQWCVCREQQKSLNDIVNPITAPSIVRIFETCAFS